MWFFPLEKSKISKIADHRVVLVDLSRTVVSLDLSDPGDIKFCHGDSSRTAPGGVDKASFELHEDFKFGQLETNLTGFELEC